MSCEHCKPCGCNDGVSAISLLGSIIAVMLSWSANKSILWAILHWLFGWWYVIYYLIFKTGA